MLRRSFIHIPGIGSVKEKNLWSRGVLTWDHLRDEGSLVFPEKKLASIHQFLNASEEAYRRRDLSFFYQNLPRDHLWRLIPEFKDDIAYLDIETTGLGFPPAAHSTTITFYFRGKLYQEHEYRKKKLLIEKMYRESSLFVTFFGEVFDIPFLKTEFGMNELQTDKAHIDLCFWLKRLGFKGGLKKVQKLFPDIPDRLAMDIDGYDAVRLWRLHEKGVDRALETLLTYNAEDTIVLEPLLIKAFNSEVESHPELALSKLAPGAWPELETGICPKVYSLLRAS